MAEEKPTPEGQSGTQVAEPEVIEMTEQELAHRIDTDPEFASAYLNGDVTLEDLEKAEPDAPAPATEPLSAPAEKDPVTPASAPQTPEPVSKEGTVATTDDGKFVVEFEDGSKLTYKSKPEALKALREKENYIRRAKTMLNESRTRELQLSERIKQLEKSSPSTPPQPVAAPKVEGKVEAKATEVLDPFDPDYQKKLADKVSAQEEMIRRLEKRYDDDKIVLEVEKAEAKQREERQTAMKANYSEANLFASRHPELKLDRPVDVIDQEYKSFLDELGRLSGTDGSTRQNVAIMDIFMDEVSEHGKKLRAEAAKIGLRPPENLDSFFRVLYIADQRKKLQKSDPDTGKLVPFTFEETYRYLQAQNGEPAPVSPPPETPIPESKSTPMSPRAQAIAAAEEQKRRVATDIHPGSSGQPVDFSQMSQEQLGAIMDIKPEILKKDPQKRALWEGVFRFLKMEPPRLVG